MIDAHAERLRRAAMRRGAWALLLGVICGCNPAECGQCVDQASCRGGRVLECAQMCKSGLAAKVDSSFAKKPFHTSPPGGDTNGPVRTLDSMSLDEPGPKGNEGPLAHEDKRSYPMEHFRWGKPGGRKRRPVKVYSNGMEEDLSEAFPTDMRRQVPEEPDYTLEGDQELVNQKNDGSYEMNHFRWSGPPASKHYSGFMKSLGGHNQKSLMTLFKNIIAKDSHW
ncbi:pro-opiomelanocortin-like isoform X2 [Paramormyrops kingsleyae]|uniref:Proopiomelanocortin b n=1 Tax=Paramormyrops kingsleyae TaxID=1676925 RepID=A0A3B3RRT5_9TELE|nr:pro-opiomelanocortin-like [Paramormyrops kingsleyae]